MRAPGESRPASASAVAIRHERDEASSPAARLNQRVESIRGSHPSWEASLTRPAVRTPGPSIPARLRVLLGARQKQGTGECLKINQARSSSDASRPSAVNVVTPRVRTCAATCAADYLYNAVLQHLLTGAGIAGGRPGRYRFSSYTHMLTADARFSDSMLPQPAIVKGIALSAASCSWGRPRASLPNR